VSPSPSASVEIDCRPLASFDSTSLDAVRRAFAVVEPIHTQQAWRAVPEPEFAPAFVRTGWRDEDLYVFAELIDADVCTTATADNQRFWEMGDTFEMFLRPDAQSAYVEFHVAPGNLQLQLRFPDGDWLSRTAPELAFSGALLPPGRFVSQAWVDRTLPGWCVLAKIPNQSVCDEPVPLDGTNWAFSFSRYDCTRGADAPVISSTSPHTLPRFHRQQEWGRLRFQS